MVSWLVEFLTSTIRFSTETSTASTHAGLGAYTRFDFNSTEKRRPYKTYPREFKLEAIRLMDESDRPASEIARELGIRRNQLYKWKEQMTKKGNVPTARRGRPKKGK